MSDNLSEVLFKPRINVPETSTISNSKAKSHVADLSAGGNKWYRILRREYWAWLGLSALDTEQLLARIAMSEAPRTSALIDTVQGYQPGAWNFEWSQQAVQFQTKAKALELEGNNACAQQAYMRACYCGTLAAYPHFRGDDLASSAHALAHNNFTAGMALNSSVFKTITIPVDGRKVSCYLHLPDTDSVKPVVLMSGSLDSIQTQFYPIFERFLAPAGIAMMCVDLPGLGACAHWDLQQDSSRIHQTILDYIPQIPWIDEARVAMLGHRFGGNIAARMAFLAPKQLKAVVTIGAPVDRLFSDIQRFSGLPQMYRDSLANRTGGDSAQLEALFYRCVPLSLKTQGILGSSRTPVPMFVSGNKNDAICPAEDMSLLANASRDAEVNVLKPTLSLASYTKNLEQVTNWLIKQLL